MFLSLGDERTAIELLKEALDKAPNYLKAR